MELLTSTQVTIPLMQVALLLGLTTGALFLGRLRLALFINYCFTLHWGYVAHIDIFGAGGGMRLDSYTLLYYGFGVVVVLLAMIGLVTHRR